MVLQILLLVVARYWPPRDVRQRQVEQVQERKILFAARLQRGRKPKAGNPDHDWQVNICQFKGRGMYLSRAGGSHSRERKCLLDLAGVVFLELSELPVVVQSKVHSILAQSSLSL